MNYRIWDLQIKRGLMGSGKSLLGSQGTPIYIYPQPGERP